MNKVVIADDECKIRLVVKTLISWEKLDLKLEGEFDNGDDLIEFLQKTDIDIVLTDMRMPGIQGKELLQKLSSINSKTKIIVISGYDDFEYLKQAIRSETTDYILKPIQEEELSNAICKAKSEIEMENKHQIEQINYLNQTLVEQLIQGNFEEERLVEEYRLKNKKHYMVAYASCYYYSQQIIKCSVKEVERSISLLLQDRGFAVYMSKESLNFILILFEEEHNIVRDIISCIQRELYSKNNFHTLVGISTVACKYSEFSNMLLEAQNALEKVNILFAEPTFFSDSKENNCKDYERPHYPVFVPAATKQFLISMQSILSQYLILEKHLCLAEIDYLKQQIFNSFQLHLKSKLEKDNLELTLGKLKKELNSFVFMNQISEIVIRFLAQIPMESSRNANKEKQEICLKIKDYLDKKFYEQIELKDIENLVFLNKEYISKIFKKGFGISIFDYIDQLRINRANELLGEGKTIQEITEIIGYYDESHFYKKYKKIMGIKPTEYQ